MKFLVFCAERENVKVLTSSLPVLPSSDSKTSSEEESMSEGEMERLKEEVVEKKTLIATLRSKPWRMKRRLAVLR